MGYLAELRRLKAAYLQKMFPQDGEMVPKIRFAGFTQSWKNQLLGELLEERKEKNLAQNLEICSVAVFAGVVNQVEHLGRSYAAENTAHYNVVNYGDIVYTKSPTGQFPYGIVKQSHNEAQVAVSPLYGVFMPSNFHIGYILHTYFCSSVNTDNYLRKIVDKGAKNTMNISNQRFLSGSIMAPVDNDEQTVLSNFFRALDNLIALHS